MIPAFCRVISESSMGLGPIGIVKGARYPYTQIPASTSEQWSTHALPCLVLPRGNGWFLLVESLSLLVPLDPSAVFKPALPGNYGSRG